MMRWPGGEAVASMREFLEGPPPVARSRGAGAVAGASAASSMLCYAPLFAAAGAEDPRALDDTQLQHFGVQKVFHRKRILRWARVLHISSDSEPEADAPCAVAVGARVTTAADAEHAQPEPRQRAAMTTELAAGAVSDAVGMARFLGLLEFSETLRLPLLTVPVKSESAPARSHTWPVARLLGFCPEPKGT